MPPAEFNSREELLGGCKDWAAHQGFAVVIARSRSNRLWLKCDRGGTYENRRNLTPDQRKRKRGDSRLLGCPFKMLATVRKDGIWRVQTDIAEHNHGPSDDLSAHPTLRRMTDEQVQKVNDMCDAGRSPAETLEELRATWPDIKVLTRDIYNARKKYKTQKELAELAAGLPEEQPFEDPNGVFPGPSPNGRWAWVPDGEEVTSKATKKRRRTAPAPPHSALDPQLQTPTNPHTSQRPMTAPGQQLLNSIQDTRDQQAFLQNQQPQYGGYDSAPNTYQRNAPLNGLGDHNGFYPSADDDTHNPPSYPNHQANTSPSRLRSQRQAAPMATMGAVPTQPDTNGPTTAQSGPKAPSGQLLMSRIERMEQEQRDQKNMLAQILGAVQGMSGNPG